MPRAIDKARDASRHAHLKLAAVCINYTHEPSGKNWTIEDISATVGTTVTDELSEYQTVTTSRHRDYLIDAAALVDQDTPDNLFEPKKGDKIAEIVDGVAVATFIVTEDPSGAAWRWHDRQRAQLRIHTVESRR